MFLLPVFGGVDWCGGDCVDGLLINIHTGFVMLCLAASLQEA
jgi:hypothetical protein